MFGSHLSISGGLHNALIEARQLSMDCVQIFTRNQRQWSPPPLTQQQISDWIEYRQKTGISTCVSHDSYLINLANPATEAWEKSVASFRDELHRCEALGIPFLVTHPGAHMNTGEKNGLKRVVQALNRLHAELPGFKVITCLEITAGQGTNLGHRLEHLAQVIQQVKHPQRLGICLDTAHMLEAGYDLTSAQGMKETLGQVEQIVGLEQVEVIHLNDSKTPRGSRVDRHEHIGQGHVALSAFQVLINHSAFVKVPKILETPKENAPDGRPWDTVNLEKLRGMLTDRS